MKHRNINWIREVKIKIEVNKVKEIIAAIDVGSHALRMKIGEVNRSGEFKELESFRKIAVLGHDTFTKGKIDFESVDQVCELLKLFKRSFADYGVSRYQAVGTSAIREASNRDYIVDQIMIKTGLDIRVISNSEEQYLTHKAVKSHLKDYERLINEGAIIVVVGAGSIQITTYKDGRLQSSQNVKMGALRIREVFYDLEDRSLSFYKICDEYISSSLEDIDLFKDGKVYQHLIAVGGEISVITKIIEEQKGKESDVLTKKQFGKLLEQVRGLSTEEIEERYQVKRGRAELIMPSMLLFKKFLEHVKSEVIITPQISLTDGIIQDLIKKGMHRDKPDKSMEDIVTNAKVLARKFDYNENHTDHVLQYATLLFDKLKAIHGMEEERVLVQVAAILHDIGKIVSLDKHYEHSYNIIRELEIFGLSQEQMEYVALISCFHSIQQPGEGFENYARQPRNKKAMIAKLIAILRIADALDRSHQGKISLESVKIKEKKVVITGVSGVTTDTMLEEWAFAKKAAFFIEVFGITPILKMKRELLQ